MVESPSFMVMSVRLLLREKIMWIRVLSLLVFMQLVSISAPAHYKNESASEFRKKYIPQDFLTSSTGKKNILGEDLNVQEVNAVFEKNSKATYTILMYRLSVEPEECKIVIVKKLGKLESILSAPVLKPYGDLSGCSDIEAVDLNQDGIDEINISRTDKRAIMAPSLLRWNGSTLEEFTPVDSSNANVGGLKNLTIFENPVRGSLIILDHNRESDPGAKFKIYKYVNNGLSLEGEYDAVSYLGFTKDAKPASLKPAVADGTYTLSVQNVSDHNRSVRAEIIVDGSTVLKPQDFCVSPQPKKSEKAKWAGNDDDDDDDKDHCKRCSAKQEVYAVVNMKLASEVSVKLYGKKNSLIKLMLIKK